jgi:hypothetical protein
MSEETPDFHHVVALLRRMGPRYQLMALYAAQFWSDEKLETAAANRDLPGRPGEVKPKAETVQ